MMNMGWQARNADYQRDKPVAHLFIEVGVEVGVEAGVGYVEVAVEREKQERTELDLIFPVHLVVCYCCCRSIMVYMCTIAY
jgi:hypothetical protein